VVVFRVTGKMRAGVDPHVSNLDRTRCLAGCEESLVP
jgi:hypothetical protein